LIKILQNSLFLTAYYILAMLVYIFALPYLVYLGFKKKYKDSIPARFFLHKNSFFKSNRVWFHACSLGEVKSIKPVIEKLNTKVNISVITNTGFSEAKKITDEVRFLPYEIFHPFWQKKQKVLVVMEAELWYMLFLIAKRKGDKTILLNARISDKSYKSYKRFSFFYKKIFDNIDEVFAQSKKDKSRLEELGAKNITVTGNIKNSTCFSPAGKYIKPDGKRVIVLASTHEDEEYLLLQNLQLQKEDMLIVVPRHPERFEKVDKILYKYSKDFDKSYIRLSHNDALQSDILLCDKMGELINFYEISDITILGGSFIDGIGGHNPLEPAYFKNIIISGEYIFNQKTLFDDVANIYISKAEKLSRLLKQDLKRSFIKNTIDLEPIIKSINKV